MDGADDGRFHAVPEGPPGDGGDAVPPEALARGARPAVFHVLFALAGAFLLLNLLFGLYAGFVQVFFPDSGAAEGFREGLGVDSARDLFLVTLLNLLLFAGVPLAWVYGTRVRPWPGGHRYLGLRDFAPAAGRGALLGLGLMVAVLVGSILWILATQGLEGITDPADETPNPVVEGILRNLTVPLALFVAFTAGFGEEVLFRGVLQKWLGWWPQAIVFGLSHAAGGDPVQIVVTLLIGLLFGYLVHRGHSLWLVISAHFTYDIGLLLMGMYAT